MTADGWAAALGLVAAAALIAPLSARPRIRSAADLGRCRTPGGVAVGPLGAGVVAVGSLGAGIAVSPGAALAVGIGALLAAARHRRRVRAGRRSAEGDALAAALEVVVGELRIGSHPVRAFEIAAGETSGAAGEALRAVAGRARIGADVSAGLVAAARGSAVPLYWERIAICWQLAAEHGLAMATLMRAAQHDVVDRQRFAAAVQADLAGARATAGILAGLPILGVVLGQLLGARPVRFLLGGGVGGWFLAAGAVLIGLGVVWSDRIVDRVARP